MAITDTHVCFIWGAKTGPEWEVEMPSYIAPGDYKFMGNDLADTDGVGVRRLTLHFDRSQATPADDDCNMHFDFVNITSGAPDDTWNTSDYTTIETAFNTWMTTAKVHIPGVCRLYRYSWHRIGPSAPKPNPAERILDLVTPVLGTGVNAQLPQAAHAISFVTGLRKHWGRTYLPAGIVASGTGRFASTAVDTVTAATVTALQACLAADFQPVVLSSSSLRAFGVEKLRGDDTIDIVRRRRWKHRVYLRETAL